MAIFTRFDIINTIGRKYLTTNIENDEFSYQQAFGDKWKNIDKNIFKSTKKDTIHTKLDIRFVDKINKISILVETKDNSKNWNEKEVEEQLSAYVKAEKLLTNNRIIAIIATQQDKAIKVYWGSDIVIDDSHKLSNQYSIKSFSEYADLYLAKENNKEQVIKSTYELNKLLHKYGINEKIRSQFVGTCLLALKYNIAYQGLQTPQIIAGIRSVLETLLNTDINKANKIALLDSKVLQSQDVKNLKSNEFEQILDFIQNEILEYINDTSTMGQDILNLFFTTFNKYVGKADKNQAFTPDHIAHFMCKVVGINRNSRVLDPCCGSGAFLVRAMTEALDDCENQQERDKVKKEQIYGIEFEDTAFGLSTTNMLIHSDGNSNVKQSSCFEEEDFIKNANINVVLMNPPYNAQKKYCWKEYTDAWNKDTKEDPSQGLHFVYYIASKVKNGKLAVLLPMQCAIGSSSTDIQQFKKKMLEEHTLDAVFSLPVDIFHPGSTSVACCMIFNLGTRHKNSKLPTFFGCYKDDGFIKRKNMGRVEKTKNNTNEGVWSDIESEWLNLYFNRIAKPGLSVVKNVTAEDEWLAEAYMENDYSTLTQINFENNLREFLAFEIKSKTDNCYNKLPRQTSNLNFDTSTWQTFKISELFNNIEYGKIQKTEVLKSGNDVYYIGAKKDDNGVISKHKFDSEYISKGNCIIMICDGQGSIGYNIYINQDFFGTINLALGYNDNLTKYNALFIITVLDLERPKFSFGRKRKSTLKNTTIKLPAKPKLNDKGEQEYEEIEDNGKKIKKPLYDPDWQYMEDYIKSLPYADLI